MTLFEWSMQLHGDVASRRAIRRRASGVFSRAIESGFHPPSLLHSRASLAIEEGDTQIAIQYLSYALQEVARLKSVSGDVPLQDMVSEIYLYNQLGVSHELIGDDGKAIESYRRGLEHNPQACELLINLSNTYRRLDRLPEASEALKKCNIEDSGLNGNLSLIYNCCYFDRI